MKILKKVLRNVSLAGVFMLSLLPAISGGGEISGSYQEMMGLFEDVIPPINPGHITKATLKEVKQPGERYFHEATFELKGRGQLKGNIKAWFKIPSEIEVSNVKITADTMWQEAVVSTQDEIERGIVKSEIRIIRFRKKAEFGSAEVRINKYSMSKVIVWSKRLGSIASKLKGLIPVPHSIMVAIEEGYRCSSIAESDKVVNEDGTLILSQATIQKYLPESKSLFGILEKVNGAEGAILKTTWEYGKGYTSIIIYDESGRISKEDKIVIARMIQRSSMLCARVLLPERAEKGEIAYGESWNVDAGHCAQLMCQGIDYDYLKGGFKVRLARPLDTSRSREVAEELGDLLEDEKSNNPYKNSFAFAVLEIDRKDEGANQINGMIKNSEAGVDSMAFSFMPKGTFYLMSDKDIPSRYIRHAEVDCDVNGNYKLSDKWVLNDMEKLANVKCKISYHQTRIAPKP